MRTPIATATPIWNRIVSGAVTIEPNVPARMRPAEVITAPVCPDAIRTASRIGPGLVLLPDAVHQEDVVVGSERHEEHEQDQRQVRADAFVAEDLLEQEPGDAERRSVGEEHGRDEVERGDHGTEQEHQHDQDAQHRDRADLDEVALERVLDVGELRRRAADVAGRHGAE